MVQAREEVARTLHDGVLQTLAVVQRRATRSDLVRLARDQERELREYLFGAEPAGGELGPRLRQAAARFEDHFDARAQVIVADDLPKLADDRVDALAGAVSEALTNAGKHGGARTVTVYAEPDDDGGVFCSVKDDGRGFEPGGRRGRRAHPVDPGPHRRRRRPGRGGRQPGPGHRGAAVGVGRIDQWLSCRWCGSSSPTTTRSGVPACAPTWAATSTWSARPATPTRPSR